MIWEPFGHQVAISSPVGARVARGRTEKIDFLLAGSQFVRVTPISLQSGEPRTLKHSKNTYKMSSNFAFRRLLYLANSPPGPLQDKPVWGTF